jgi:hypothetical protein
MLHLLGLLEDCVRHSTARAGAVMVLALSACWPSQASARHTSTECPAQTATVISGGSVTINVTDCAFNIGFAGVGPINGGSLGPPDFKDHGTATLRITGQQWFLHYSHNGVTGIGSTDVFEFADGSFNGDGGVRFTITTNASASHITVTAGTLLALTFRGKLSCA